MHIKRLLFVVSVLTIVSNSAFGQTKWNQRFQNYIDTYKEVAIQEMLLYKIPASITLAQGLLESGAGESELSVKGNNHFGIKCHNWSGRTTYHDDDKQQECFRAYDSPVESYEDHSKFLVGKQRYASLFQLSLYDYKGWAHGLKAAGYATNPQYAYRLIDIIETYQLNQYDYATSVDKKAIEQLMLGKAAATPKDKRRGDITADYAPVIEAPMGNHEVRLCNNTYYVLTRNGDTLEGIAYEMGVKVKDLARFNELPSDAQLRPDRPIYLEKKQKRSDKIFCDNPHVVQAGESMHDIAQMYAIRLDALYKLNRMPADYRIKPGDVIRVY